MTTQTNADPILFTTRHLALGRGPLHGVWLASGLVAILLVSFIVQLGVCIAMLAGIFDMDSEVFGATAFMALWFAFVAPFLWIGWSFGGEEEVISVTREHLRVSSERGGKEIRHRWYPRDDVRNLRYDPNERALAFDWQQQKTVYVGRSLRTFEAGILRAKIIELWGESLVG